MTNTKTVKTRSKSGNSAKKVVKKSRPRRVVDPMIVSRKTALKNEDILAEENVLSYDGVDDKFDDLYGMDELDDKYSDDEYNAIFDDIYGKKSSSKKSSKMNEKSAKAKSTKAVREDDFEDEKPSRPLTKKQIARRKKLEKRRIKKAKKGYRTPLWAKIVITILVLLIGAIIAAGIYAYNILSSTSNIFEGNPLDFLVGTDLQEDENGWSHTLIFGTADEGSDHPGEGLTDSIIVLSVNQKHNIAKTFSIPRDLYVDLTPAGESTLYCIVGYKAKINNLYDCARSEFGGDKKKSAAYFAKKVSEITGLSIQYYAAVDWSVLIGVVDAIGGIDVEPYTDDPRGIKDICQQIDWEPGVRHINGNEALRLARARGACYPTYGVGIQENYGLSRSNFDREINQQRIINAIKDKALSIGILADPNKVFSILDSFGNNIQTNITMAEIRTFIDITMAMKGEVEHIDTVNWFGTDRLGEQSIVVPRGYSMYDYTKIHNETAKAFTKVTVVDSEDE